MYALLELFKIVYEFCLGVLDLHNKKLIGFIFINNHSMLTLFYFGLLYKKSDFTMLRKVKKVQIINAYFCFKHVHSGH